MPKNNKSDKFLKLVDKHRETKKVDKFEGTLSEYLKVLEGDTSSTKLAHKRLYDAIATHGATARDHEGQRRSPS